MFPPKNVKSPVNIFLVEPECDECVSFDLIKDRWITFNSQMGPILSHL